MEKSTCCGCETWSRKHGLYNSRIYKIWVGMISRCRYPYATHYSQYGGRGILVCERWQDKFEYFLEDMGLPPSLKHTIDRLNVDGNYEPDNCCWATKEEQQQNQRRTKLNPAKVLEIRALASVIGRLELARRYAVCPHMIDHVVKGTAWKNIGGDVRPKSPFGGRLATLEYKAEKSAALKRAWVTRRRKNGVATHG